MSEYGPQDPRILIGKRYGCLLPPRPVSKLGDPLRNRVGSSVSRKHGGASSLDQQHPQVSVAALRYASERRLSAAGTLPRRQAEPGPELRATPELLEVTHGGDDRGCGNGADPVQLSGDLHGIVFPVVCRDPLVAPSNLLVELTPVPECPIEDLPSHEVELIARVFKDVGQALAKASWILRNDNTEFSEQAANPIDAGGPLLFHAFPETMHAEHALLCRRLDRNEMHMWSGCRFTDCCRVIRVVLSRCALHAIGRYQMRSDDPRIQTHSPEPTAPVMGTCGGLHGYHATHRQLSAPLDKPTPCNCASGNYPTSHVDSVDLQDLLRQVNTDSHNVFHFVISGSVG